MTRGMIGLCLLSSLLGCAGPKANTNPDRPEFLAHTQPQEAVYLPRGGQGAGGSIAAAGPAPSTPVWSVRAGQNLSDIIREWGVQANRTVVWQTAHDWPIVVDDQFEGSFDEALAWVLAGVADTSPRPSVQRFQNDSVRVLAEE